MSLYKYSPLPAGNIRVLRLLPSEANDAPLECQLFDYPLLGRPIQGYCPYEALSYVWGSEEKPFSISILRRQSTASEPAQELRIGANLDSALRHLRDGYAERLLWIDALCINQDDLDEKATQVQLMVEVYARANRVIVWLGEGDDDSDEALEELRMSALNKPAPKTLWRNHAESIKPWKEKEEEWNWSWMEEEEDQVQNANDCTKGAEHLQIGAHFKVINLLQRPWFRRVWVLQEIAAARHLVIKCGVIEIDGYAFSSGLRNMALALQACPELSPDMMFTANLIAGAVFRSRSSQQRKHPTIYPISNMPLAQLLDFYRTREATKDVDKVFALLGMSNDHFPGSGSPIEVDYRLPWGTLADNLVKTLFTKKATVEGWCGSPLVVVRAKGRALAVVRCCERDKERQEDHLEVGIFSNHERIYSQGNSWSRRVGKTWFPDLPNTSIFHVKKDLSPQFWSIPAPPGTILPGDMVCLLDGAQRPIIIRLCGDYWGIVMAWTPLMLKTDNPGQPCNSPDGFFNDFLLVWDWKVQSEPALQRPIFLGDVLSGRGSAVFLQSGMSNTPEDEANRLVQAASVISDPRNQAFYDHKIESILCGRMLRILEKAVLKRGLGSREVLFPLATNKWMHWKPLPFAAAKGRTRFAEWLIETAGLGLPTINGELLLHAVSEKGRLEMVQFLLNRNADPNQSLSNGQTPLFYAALNMEPPVIRTLLKHNADIHIRNWAGDTVLGVIIKHLLHTCRRELTELELETVRVLLEHGANPNEIKDDHSSCKHPKFGHIMRRNQPPLLRLLLDYGVEPCARDPVTGNYTQNWVSGFKEISVMLREAQESCPLHGNKHNTTSGLQGRPELQVRNKLN